MKVKEKAKKNGEYFEYQRIIKLVDSAHKKALTFTKTEFQKEFERVYSSC